MAVPRRFEGPNAAVFALPPREFSVMAARASPPPASPPAPRWDGSRVLFEIIVDGEAVPCAISREALREVTGRGYGKPAELLASFLEMRARIEAVARAKHRAKSEAATGLLTVWSGDLEDEAEG
jgi:hypothetical protein